MALASPLLPTLAALACAAALVGFAAGKLRARVPAAELALWAGWIALAVHHERLGLAGSAQLVMALGIVLAAARACAFVPVLARTARRGRSSSTWAAFAVSLAFLLFLWPWSRAERAPDGDEPYYLLLTESLAFDFDVDLADEYRDGAAARFTAVEIAPQPGDPVGPHGERWSRHAALLPLLLAPLRRIGGVAGAELGMVLLAAALAAALFALVRERFGAPAAAPVWALVTLAPPLFIYSGRLWVEVPAALALALALLAAGRIARHGATRVELVRLGLALAALPLLKLRFLAIALPLLLVVLLRAGGGERAQRKRLVRAALAAAGGLALLALWNAVRFGNPLRMYAVADLDPTATTPAAWLRGAVGLGFDPAFGLFAWSPLWLLLAPALVVAWRRRALALAEVAAIAPYVFLVAGRREWYGGWSPPFRYGVVLLPVLALLLAPLFAERRPRGALVATLVVASLPLALVAALHPAWTFSLADGGSRPLAELATIFGGDLARFLPSAVRPRLATWLWLAALPLVAALALVRRRRRPRAGGAAFVGVSVVLAAFAGWLALAAYLPTRIVEAEDPWVDKRGGGVHPGPWTMDRTAHTGGWNLAAGHELSFLPVTGGPTAVVTVRAAAREAPAGRVALELLRRGEPVARFAPPADAAGAFVALVSPPVSLAHGDRLTLRAFVSDGEAGAGHWVVDRLELDWR